MRRTIITNTIICVLTPILYLTVMLMILAYVDISTYLIINIGFIWITSRSIPLANYWLYLWYVIDREEYKYGL